MQHDFWHERWQLNQIAFHGQEINPHLQHYWPALKLAPASRVLVPLCGKSRDMLWLRAQGHEVMGVELSPLAVEAFFTENDLQASHSQQGSFRLSQSGGLSLYCGNFFELTTDDMAGIGAVYDRAALVALPPDMRIDYAALIQRLLPNGSKILLVAFDYPQAEMSGPPFSVPDSEVQALYRDSCDVELLFSEDMLDREPQFRDRGLSRMREQVYLLTKR